jgi:hypothetical protein
MILGFGSSRIGRPLNKNLPDSWKDSIFYNFNTHTMQALTIEQANQMPYIDWVKHFKPDWTDEQCDFYLWEYTCFPFGFKDVIKQLNEQLGF